MKVNQLHIGFPIGSTIAPQTKKCILIVENITKAQLTVIERRRSCLFSMQVAVQYVIAPIIGVIREKNTNVQNVVKKLAV